METILHANAIFNLHTESHLYLFTFKYGVFLQNPQNRNFCLKYLDKGCEKRKSWGDRENDGLDATLISSRPGYRFR